ncbi:MAG: tRNA-(ms[2]io[6]A)-hydroxylase [Bacteroidota bacterium]
MKLSADLVCQSPDGWIKAVLEDFDTFLQDHADCERKASAMAMSFVARYPDRLEILPELIETAVEELEHFQQVYQIMEKRGVRLPAKMTQDLYVKELLSHCRTGRDERFIDRMLWASVIECRGAERFRLVYQSLPVGALKEFYHQLWASEAKHGHIFVKMLFNYFPEEPIYKRLYELVEIEAEALLRLPIRPALH